LIADVSDWVLTGAFGFTVPTATDLRDGPPGDQGEAAAAGSPGSNATTTATLDANAVRRDQRIAVREL
jgi:hypothetical protein